MFSELTTTFEEKTHNIFLSVNNLKEKIEKMSFDISSNVSIKTTSDAKECESMIFT